MLTFPPSPSPLPPLLFRSVEGYKLVAGACQWAGASTAAPAITRTGTVQVPIAPRIQYLIGDGFCAEEALQMTALHYGVWIPQLWSRKLVGNSLLPSINYDSVLQARGGGGGRSRDAGALLFAVLALRLALQQAARITAHLSPACPASHPSIATAAGAAHRLRALPGRRLPGLRGLGQGLAAKQRARHHGAFQSSPLVQCSHAWAEEQPRRERLLAPAAGSMSRQPVLPPFPPPPPSPPRSPTSPPSLTCYTITSNRSSVSGPPAPPATTPRMC